MARLNAETLTKCECLQKLVTFVLTMANQKRKQKIMFAIQSISTKRIFERFNTFDEANEALSDYNAKRNVCEIVKQFDGFKHISQIEDELSRLYSAKIYDIPNIQNENVKKLVEIETNARISGMYSVLQHLGYEIVFKNTCYIKVRKAQ